MVAIYFFGGPLDKIWSEGQKQCAEVRRVEDAEVRRGERATARAKTKAKFGGPLRLRSGQALHCAADDETVRRFGRDDGCVGWGEGYRLLPQTIPHPIRGETAKRMGHPE